MASIWDKLIRRASLKALNNLNDNNYKFISKNQLFLDISAEALVFVMNAMQERHYNQGELIFNEGNPGICLFIVKSGRVETYSESDVENDDTTFYCIADEGSIFGEISVITTAYRTSSAKAMDHDTILLSLSSFDIEQLFERFPQDGLTILRSLTNSITGHLAKSNQKIIDLNKEIEALKEKLENE